VDYVRFFRQPGGAAEAALAMSHWSRQHRVDHLVRAAPRHRQRDEGRDLQPEGRHVDLAFPAPDHTVPLQSPHPGVRRVAGDSEQAGQFRDAGARAVVENKRAFVEPMIRDALYDLPERPRVLGKDLLPVDGELDADRIGYQDERYARRYLDVLALVENAAVREVMARKRYKLMAYKDEYEVTRLRLDPALRAQVGPDATVKYMLHPPPRAMRKIRGSKLDPFGQTALRRLERDLVDEYVTVVGRLADLPESLALEIAGLPDLVRGYAEIKIASVARYRERMRELLTEAWAQWKRTNTIAASTKKTSSTTVVG
jgi:Family of unknown function (DUF6537)